MLSVVALSGAYLVVAKPIYRAEAFLSPPAADDIAALKIIYSEINKDYSQENTVDITASAIYTKYLTTLKSKVLFNNYFSKIYETKKGIDSNVGDMRVTFLKNTNNELVTVTLESTNADDLERWLDDLLSLASKSVINRYALDINVALDVRKRILRNEIDNRRKLALQQREDEIRRLEEQYKIAEQLVDRELILFG